LSFAADTSIVIAVGDIAKCRNLNGARATSRLAAAVAAKYPESRVISLGDHTYPRGAPKEFDACYEPTWGVHNERTAPSPGNHEYRTHAAEPYFDYFDWYRRFPEARQRGYYAFDVAGWRILSLNSNLPMHPDSDQVRWLEADLRAADRECVLAYWHHPRFSSGVHGRQRRDPGRATDALWEALAEQGADVVVNGHTHMYERFTAQTPDGQPARRGMTQFVAGTGGASHDRALRPLPNSAYINDDVYGVLVLALGRSSFEWAFLGIDGAVYDRSEAPVSCL
jgi:alkaline phosphatase